MCVQRFEKNLQYLNQHNSTYFAVIASNNKKNILLQSPSRNRQKKTLKQFIPNGLLIGRRPTKG